LAGRKIPRGSAKSADASATASIPDSPDISLNDVLHFHDCAHGDGLRADKNVTGFDVSWIHDGAMDSSDALDVYITDWTKLQNILSLDGRRIPQESAKLGGCQCNHRTEFPAPDISLNDILYFHDCAKQSTPPTRIRVSTFPGNPRTVPWIVLTPRMSTLRDWTKPQNTFYGWTTNPQNQRKLGGQCNVQNIPDSPDISLNDVSFTSMTVHMETVYAADKNVTSFDFLGTTMTVPWIARMLQCLHHGLDEATQYTFYGWA
jgi:hypothetical protein